ncbi:hypothetical protein R83H12_00567 [Fibrobacteria bacterium R8-3-H12]
MNKVKSTLLAAMLLLAIAFTFSCSSDDGGNNGGTATVSSSSGKSESSSSSIAGGGSNSSGSSNATIKKAKISGVSQKGPFVKGTRATLYELNKNFAQTGRSFFDIIADDKGTFEIKDVELASPYALLEADGFYRNEVTGKVSAAPIKLYAIADIREKDNININLLTHLEYYRVQALALAGESLKEAKKQAQKEILDVFSIEGDFINSEDMSIFGITEGDAVLLAISVLLQGDLSEGEFSQRLTDFAQSLKTSGKWDNEAEKTAMADWAAGVNLEGIKQNILGWGLSKATPDLGKYVNGYVAMNYGLGECNAENIGKVKGNFICKKGLWKFARNEDPYCVTTQSCEILTDIRDGNDYWVSKINGQYKIWMVDPLTYHIEDKSGGNPYYDSRRFWPEEILNNRNNICPANWHLPSRAELEAIVPSSYIEKNDFTITALSRLLTDEGIVLQIVQDGPEWYIGEFFSPPAHVYCVKD